MSEMIRNLFSDEDPTPNKLTIAMGQLIKEAREEAGLSQSELARKIYRRQATLSAIELGKSEATISTLLYLAAALKKPISYFIPKFAAAEISKEDLRPIDQDLLEAFWLLWDEKLQRVAIGQIKALSKFDPREPTFEGLIQSIVKHELEEDVLRVLVNMKDAEEKKA